MEARRKKSLEDVEIPVKIKISALWASAMFLYVYGDYFTLFKPHVLQSMLAGRMGPFEQTTQAILFGTTLMMAIPSVMIFLSLALRPNLNRWTNIVLGVLYTLIILVTVIGDWAFMIFLGAVEMLLTGLIVWYAWTWPKQTNVALS